MGGSKVHRTLLRYAFAAAFVTAGTALIPGRAMASSTGCAQFPFQQTFTAANGTGGPANRQLEKGEQITIAFTGGAMHIVVDGPAPVTQDASFIFQFTIGATGNYSFSISVPNPGTLTIQCIGTTTPATPPGSTPGGGSSIEPFDFKRALASTFTRMDTGLVQTALATALGDHVQSELDRAYDEFGTDPDSAAITQGRVAEIQNRLSELDGLINDHVMHAVNEGELEKRAAFLAQQISNSLLAPNDPRNRSDFELLKSVEHQLELARQDREYLAKRYQERQRLQLELRNLERPAQSSGYPVMFAPAEGNFADRFAGMPPQILGYAGVLKAPEKRTATRKPRSRFSTWIAGSLGGFSRDDAASANGNLSYLAGGVDYRLFQRLLVGVLGTYERFNFGSGFNAGSFRGSGVTVGPYVGFTVAPHVTAHVAVGATFMGYDQSDNVSAGSFHATRAFINAGIEGTWRQGPWRITPRGTVFYAQEKQEGYTDSLRNLIPGQTVQLGRASIGPEVGYTVRFANGRWIEPFLFAAADIDFANQRNLTVANGIVFTQEPWGGRAGGGFNLGIADNATGKIGASYEGLGRNANVWRADARVSIRF
jgi:hypothetical protein